jgi:hypothetical protein
MRLSAVLGLALLSALGLAHTAQAQNLIADPTFLRRRGRGLCNRLGVRLASLAARRTTIPRAAA